MIRIKLRQILWDKGLTAAAVHRATGISSSILSDIIHEKRFNVGLDIIDKLCLFLQCDLNDLLLYKPINTQNTLKNKRTKIKKND